MARERLQTRDDPDTIEQVEQFAADKEISQSEAVRRLIRAGLVEAGYRDGAAAEPQLATARINETARTAGGLAIGLLVVFLTLSEVGLV